VAIAAFLTALATLSLTLYAFFTTKDFTFALGSLYLFSAALLGCTVLAIFLPNNQLLRLVISGVSVLLFGLYLIFDI
jgi:FtsH-binding integral membrane protein